mmetsp:Transcript_35405/g.85412  ORF Transcript_35405/g.85412 Transcript_35405/m.85412 type:complete len:144 (+) Transcript_35405:1-432(+)
MSQKGVEANDFCAHHVQTTNMKDALLATNSERVLEWMHFSRPRCSSDSPLKLSKPCLDEGWNAHTAAIMARHAAARIPIDDESHRLPEETPNPSGGLVWSTPNPSSGRVWSTPGSGVQFHPAEASSDAANRSNRPRPLQASAS